MTSYPVPQCTRWVMQILSRVIAVCLVSMPLSGQVRYASSVIGFSTEYNTTTWSAGQALGAPNVYPNHGDIAGAWASATQDGQREFLVLGFSDPAPVQSIALYETYNPGAVDTIYVKNPGTGQWQVVWSGTAAAAPAQARIFIANFTLTSFNVSEVRIAINSSAVSGWNEIDAVGISSQTIPSSGGLSTGTVAGRVTDALNGNAVSGAAVSIAGLSATSGADGSFTIPNVPVGTLRADFSASPRSGAAPLAVQFADGSTEGTQTLSVSATGYVTYSNNQVVVVAGGTSTANVSLSPQLSGNMMRLVLNWGESPSDLDSYLVTPSINGMTYTVSFSNQGSSTSPPYATLDHDVTQGRGPETITIHQFVSGTYKYYVNQWSSSGTLAASNASVQVYTAQGLVRTIQIPTTGSGEYWNVLTIDGSTKALTVINQIVTTRPSSLREWPGTEIKSRKFLKGGVAERGQSITSWAWDFGDGTTSTQQNPSHTYQAGGTYTITLSVTATSGTATERKTGYISVTGSQATGGLTGRVTDALTGNGISGASVSIGGLSTTSGADGSFTISGVPVGTLRAEFSASTRSGMIPLNVQFTDASTEGTQTLTVNASGYVTYSNNQVAITAGGTLTLNVSLSPQLTGGALRLVLNWGTSPKDLDSYLVTPAINGTPYTVSYSSQGNSTSPPYATLDHDVTEGLGPETITIHQFVSGTYKYYVNQWSSIGTLAASNASVQVYTAQGLVRTIQIPTTGSGEYWNVLTIDGATKSLTIINQIIGSAPASLHDVPTPGMKNRQMEKGAAPHNLLGITAWSWTFGDGTSSTQQHPQHTYQAAGTYTVSLTVTGTTGTATEQKTNYITVAVTGVEREDGTIPDRFRLEQNYPNPFNPRTTIRFSVPASGFVTLRMYNLLGSEVATLVAGDLSAGTYTVDLQADHLPSGVYVCRLQAGIFTELIKMTLMK